MRSHVVCALVWAGVALALGVGTGHGQEGHPLTGTWSGDWGPNDTDRRHLTVVMTWDGAAVSAIINPGPGAVTATTVELDVTEWTVRLQAERPGTAEEPVAITAEGRIDDLGSPHRTIAGTWREGGTSGRFQLTRD